MSKQIIAAIAVVAALAAAYFLFTEPEPQREPGDVWRVPLIEDFNRFDVRHDDTNETIAIERRGAGWRIQEPIDFRAASRQVERVEQLFTDQDERLLADDEKDATPNNLTRYGFDDDVFHVTVYDAGEAVASFAVGHTEEDEAGRTRTWVRPEDEGSIYRLNRDLRARLDHPLSTWRDNEVLALARDERERISAVEVSYPTGSLRVEKSDGEWALVDPGDVEFDADLIDRWVRRIDRLRAADFADDVTADEAGLVQPEHTVTIVLDEGETGEGEPTEAASYELAFGATFAAPGPEGDEGEAPTTREQRRYVRLGDGPVFAVSVTDAERFVKRTGDFRPREVLTVERDSVARIDLVDADGRLILLRDELSGDAPEGDEAGEEATWQMQVAEADDEAVDRRQLEPVDMAAMRRVLTAAAEVEAARFDDDVTVAAAGLESPRRRVLVTLDDGTVHELEVGGPAEAVGDGEAGDVDHFARVDDGLIFVLRDFKVRNLLTAADDLRPEGEGEDG